MTDALTDPVSAGRKAGTADAAALARSARDPGEACARRGDRAQQRVGIETILRKHPRQPPLREALGVAEAAGPVDVEATVGRAAPARSWAPLAWKASRLTTARAPRVSPVTTTPGPIFATCPLPPPFAVRTALIVPGPPGRSEAPLHVCSGWGHQLDQPVGPTSV